MPLLTVDAPTAVVCEVRRFNVKQKVRNEWQHQQQALLPCASLFERYDPKIPRTVCPMDGEMRATHGFTAHFLQLMRAEVVNGVRGVYGSGAANSGALAPEE